MDIEKYKRNIVGRLHVVIKVKISLALSPKLKGPED